MKQLLFILFVCSSFMLHAQTDDYRLDSYVNPDYKRKELDFKFDASGSIESEKSERGTPGFENLNVDAEKQFFAGSIESRFYQVENSPKKQSTTRATFSTSGTYLNNGFSDEKANAYDLWGSYHNTGYYYGRDKKFIEFSPEGYLHYTHSSKDYKYMESSDIEEANKSTSIGFSFRLGIGKGRIEQVGDARLAMYILSELKDNGSLRQVLSLEEVNKLAQQITTIKNKRQFDSRIKLIEEIATIDSFLAANGYIEPSGSAKYFTSLYDNWLYAGLFERAAGSRFTVGLSPGYRWIHSKTDYVPTYHRLNYSNYDSNVSAAVYISYQYEKPANLYWQHSVAAEVKGGWMKYRELDSYIESHVSGNYSLGYYPNSRTHIIGSCHQNFQLENSNGWDHFISRSSLGMNMYYYLSPQLRLNARSSLNYNYSDLDNFTNQNKYPNFSFNIGLEYSIF